MSEQSNELNELISFFQADEMSGSAINNLAPAADRRSGSRRPWSATASQGSGVPVAELKKTAGSDIDNSDWEEF